MRRNWVVTSLAAILTFILGASLNGIIGNRSDNLFVWAVNQLKSSFTTSFWPWIITSIILLISLIIIFSLLQRNRVLHRALSTANHIADLDDSLLRLLASWIPTKNHDKEMKSLLEEVLREASEEFAGHVHRAAILRPDPDTNEEDLTIWAHIGMPQESIDLIKFHIGNNKEKIPLRGVAGEVFLSKKLRVGHIILENDETWRCDYDSFIKFATRNRLPPYRSFASVPIIGADPDNPDADTAICLGVVNFDSMDHKIFDTPESHVVLRTFARRIAAALLIYRQLDTPSQNTQQTPQADIQLGRLQQHGS